MAEAMGWIAASAGAGGKGQRTLAFWDEDSVTMAVAAARAALRGQDLSAIRALSFATISPPYAEPQNASLVHAALRLPQTCRTQDMQGTPRAALLALHAALEAGEPALIAAGDLPPGAPGGMTEARAGDGGAAALVGPGAGMLDYLGGASIAAPFVDRYRAAGQDHPQDWEERWVREAGYLELVPEAIAQALQQAGLAPDQIDHIVLPCPISGVAAGVAARAGLKGASLAGALSDTVGDTGTAHPLLMLAHHLEAVRPGQMVLVAQFGQGATALVFRAGPGCGAPSAVAPLLARGIDETNYTKMLAFRGQIAWDRGLRGRFYVAEALTTAWRYSDALLGFVGGRCRETGRVQFPPTRLTAGEGLHLDSQDPWPLADLGGRVATFTADLLAFSPHPPNCYGLVDLTGGGRLLMEFTDPDAAAISPGTEVEFVFRIKDLDPQTGYRRYFWKAIATSVAS